MSTLTQHSAEGQSLGYIWQIQVALLRLAEGSPGGTVGIETLDDVAYEDRSGNIILSQLKSTVDFDRNPVSDSAVQLWKTLATWTTALEAGEIDSKRTRLILLTNATLEDCLATRIGAASDEASVAAVVKELRLTPKKKAKTVAPFIDRVRAANDNQISELVRCIEVQHGGTGHSHAGVREQILAKCHLPDGVDVEHFLNAMVGWLHNLAISHWSKRESTYVVQASFNNMRQHVVELQRRRRVRELPSKSIACDSSAKDSHRAKGFVRQLEVIDADADTVDDAITDFIKHNHERLRLAKEGQILDEDWSEFETRLIEYWKPVHRAQPASKSKTEMRRVGRIIYTEIQKHKEILAGEPTDEYYLTRGAYQRLADDAKVGWHPQYRTLIRATPTS